MNQQQFLELHNKIKSGTATKSERKKYADYLLEKGQITPDEHKQFVKGDGSEDVINIIIGAGLLLLLFWGLKKIFGK